MYYNISFVSGNVVVGSSEVECSAKEVLADGRVEFFDVKANKTVMLCFQWLQIIRSRMQYDVSIGNMPHI